MVYMLPHKGCFQYKTWTPLSGPPKQTLFSRSNKTGQRSRSRDNGGHDGVPYLCSFTLLSTKFVTPDRMLYEYFVHSSLCPSLH